MVKLSISQLKLKKSVYNVQIVEMYGMEMHNAPVIYMSFVIVKKNEKQYNYLDKYLFILLWISVNYKIIHLIKLQII